MIVMNGDILTKVAVRARCSTFHIEHGSAGTMCVRDYILQVPYGVIAIDEHRLSEIVEKPVHRFLVNAGIYVLEPQRDRLVPRGTLYDMPTLFEEIRRRGTRARAFSRSANTGSTSAASTTSTRPTTTTSASSGVRCDQAAADDRISSRVLALIPARGGSKGVPRKNIRHVARQAADRLDDRGRARPSRYHRPADPVEDDAAIIEVATEFGCEVPFVRPAELATDEADEHGRGPSRAVGACRNATTILVLLQPTSPLRDGGRHRSARSRTVRQRAMPGLRQRLLSRTRVPIGWSSDGGRRVINAAVPAAERIADRRQDAAAGLLR